MSSDKGNMGCAESKEDGSDALPDLSNWMRDLSDDKKRKPLLNLVIPGSHDTLTYQLFPEMGVANDQPQWLRDMDSPNIRKVVQNWSTTQALSLPEQLKAGVRYLDLRVAVPEKEPSAFRIVHGLYGIKVDDALTELVSFLGEHLEEVVLLDVNHFYGFDEEAHQRLQQLIVSSCGASLAPAGMPPELSLHSLLSKKHQIVCTYRVEGSLPPQLWPGVVIQSPWADTDKQKALLAFLTKGLEEREGVKTSLFFVSQGILTARLHDIIARPCGSLRNSLAMPTTKALLPWLSSLTPETKASLNVVLADFVDADGFLPAVVALNS